MINVYEDSIDSVTLSEIVKFAADCEIGEDFDTGCDLVYTWTEFNKIVAVIAFKRYEFEPGRIVPRVEHIVFDKNHNSHKQARSSYRFLLYAFSDIKKRGYAQVWAYILTGKEYMKKLAEKFGFKKYAEDKDGEYLAIQLITKGQ
jgi:hypothetical protein